MGFRSTFAHLKFIKQDVIRPNTLQRLLMKLWLSNKSSLCQAIYGGFNGSNYKQQ